MGRTCSRFHANKERTDFDIKSECTINSTLSSFKIGQTQKEVYWTHLYWNI